MASRRLLLIDDEDDIREVAKLSLELVAHWDVLTACSGAEGIERAIEHQPDAILLDVMMPGMDGAATYAALRSSAATRDIPVVLLTAKIFDRAGDRRGLEGITVISKPFDPMRLATQVAAALGWAG